MKSFVAAIIFGFIVSSGAGEPPLQRSKSSSALFNLEDELKDFYLHLVDTNQSVQKTIASLIVKEGDSGDDILESSAPAKGPSGARQWISRKTARSYLTSEPRVVAWFPGETDGDTEKFNDEQNYLVVVAVSQSHHHGESVPGALVAEFHVSHAGKTKLNRAGTRADVISNKIVLTFLGFRQFQLIPLEHQK